MGNSPKGEYMLKKINILKLFGIGSICLFLLGCSEESFLMQENASEVKIESDSEITLMEEEELLRKETDISGEQDSNGIIQSEDEKEAENRKIQKEIAVHICGAVNHPGVYYLEENQRLHEAIDKAGGFREDADEDYLNQALVLEDGMKIVVPTREEVLLEGTALEAEDKSSVSGESADLSKNIFDSQESQKTALEEGFLHKKEDTDETPEQAQKIDLNTADETLLCTLPGIGESRAKSIIAYRQENGPFRSTEDVMKVSGIKEAAYAKIKDYIMVSD